MSKQIAKSPEMLAKEEEIKSLASQIKKSRTTLKRLKTRLNNTKEEFVSLQHKIQTEITARMEKTHALVEELQEYAQKLLQADFLTPENRDELKALLETISNKNMFGDEFEDYLETKKEAENGEFDFDEQTRARAYDLFQEFNIEPEEKEQRNIRKVFIHLSSKFHPDKAKNDKEREDFHSLMQEINAAYKSHDIDKLLEIERLYINSETIDLEGRAVTVDILEEEIKRLKQELEFIKNQIQRTSGELKNFRDSDFGKALSQSNKLEREGNGFNQGIEELNHIHTTVSDLLEAIKASLEQGQFSPNFYQIMIKNTPEEEMAAMFEEMGEEDFFSMIDLFQDEMSHDYEPIENPVFKEDQTVEVVTDAISSLSPDFNFKGLTGVVVDSYTEDGEDYYVVSFDSKSLSKLPDHYVNALLSQDYPFESYPFSSESLKAVKLPADTEEELERVFSEKELRGKIYEFPQEIKEIIFKVVLSGDPEIPGLLLWFKYLQDNLPLPLEVKSRGAIREVRKNTKFTILGFTAVTESLGIVCLVQKGKNKHPTTHPLADLEVRNKKDKAAQDLLMAFSTWYFATAEIY